MSSRRSKTYGGEIFPSFMCLSEQKENHVSLKRNRTSPTGKTPHQPSKREFKDQSLTRSVWNVEEKAFLKRYVSEAGGVPTVGSNAFWSVCAEKLNQMCGSSRTGLMCRSHYTKTKSLFSSFNESVLGNTVATQTTPAIPIVRERCYSTTIPLVSAADISLPEGKNAATKAIFSKMEQRFRTSDWKVPSESDFSDVLAAILSGDIDSIAASVIRHKDIRASIERKMLEEIEQQVSSKCRRSPDSYLFPKDYDALLNFSVNDVVKEFSETAPFLFRCILSTIVPENKLIGMSEEKVQNTVPQLAMIYSILMSLRFHELSRMKRLISVVLLDSHTHEKVYDRLNAVGISTSYQAASRVVDEIGKHNYDTVIQTLKNGNPFRLIGDNININVSVRHERSDAKGTMYNWFASAIITQKRSFTELPDIPQCESKDLPLEAFIPTNVDERRLIDDYIVLISRVAKEHLPQLDFLSGLAKNVISPQYSEDIKKKNLVVALPVLPFNEQKYADVVQILDKYEEYITDIYQSAGVQVGKVHIGGDQLTRERFSGAKRLRTVLNDNDCVNQRQCFKHLQPITFELWHCLMNFLVLIFKTLYNEQSFNKGSMNAARIKLGRRTVKKDVQHNYDHNKDFFMSFTRAYIVEALCDFFGMEDTNSMPVRNLPADKPPHEIMDTFVRQYVFAENTDATQVVEYHQPVIKVTPISVTLPDGSTTVLELQQTVQNTATCCVYDRVKHYGHTVLQLGLLFFEFIDICKVPDRDRMITFMKYLMPVFKASSNNSKYALECLRFLCHQQSSYSLREASLSFYGLFVNNRGKVDSNIPADLQMEHLVKKMKGLFQSSGPHNKSDSMAKKSKALSGISNICENYDVSNNVIVRATHHKSKTAIPDEQKIILDLRNVQPFKVVLGRNMDWFEKTQAPYEANLELDKYHAWLNHHKATLMFESGK